MGTGEAVGAAEAPVVPELDTDDELVVRRPDHAWAYPPPALALTLGARWANDREKALTEHGRGNNAQIRLDALKSLRVWLDDPQARTSYFAAFDDPDPHLRVAALDFVVNELWQQSEPGLVDRSLKLARRDPEGDVREAALHSLMPYLQRPDVFEAWKSMIMDGSEPGWAVNSIVEVSASPARFTNGELLVAYDLMKRFSINPPDWSTPYSDFHDRTHRLRCAIRRELARDR